MIWYPQAWQLYPFVSLTHTHTRFICIDSADDTLAVKSSQDLKYSIVFDNLTFWSTDAIYFIREPAAFEEK